MRSSVWGELTTVVVDIIIIIIIMPVASFAIYVEYKYNVLVHLLGYIWNDQLTTTTLRSMDEWRKWGEESDGNGGKDAKRQSRPKQTTDRQQLGNSLLFLFSVTGFESRSFDDWGLELPGKIDSEVKAGGQCE